MLDPTPPVLLVILDGWGERDETAGNAIRLARTPAYDHLVATAAGTRLAASGTDVGLPSGLMGNSEVGHLNIGSGRVVEQDVVRISRAVDARELDQNQVAAELLERVAARGAALHLMGLVSDGGVHSLDRHLAGLVELARRRGLEDVRVHAFLDGRDTPPRSALEHLGRLEDRLAAIGTGRVVTVCGRYYAMDRDRRWPRVERAWRAIVRGDGERAPSARRAVERSYEQGVGDEFVLPTVIAGDDEPGSRLGDGDGVVFFNFRADRARQMTRALSDPGFDGFERGEWPRIELATMTEYDADLGLPVLFPPQSFDGILADAMAGAGVANLRVAETEKYAHVTYFMNGGREEPWPREERRLVPSQTVATYDLAPEMSAAGITDIIVASIAAGGHRAIIANYANADMVGHTGVLEATVAAVEVLDGCLRSLVTAVDAHGWALMLTADHGNAELMVDPETGGPHTAHTTNPVPLLVRVPGRRLGLRPGRLADVAPTLLDLWGIGPPKQMTGESLLVAAGGAD